MFNTHNQVFQYNGSTVTFKKGCGTVMVNATEMAKPFGKLSKDFLSTKSAKELISTLSAVRGIPLTGLVIVNQGGSNQGTWMHEDVALEFARWLSPAFAIWCNDRIKELLRTGVTTVSNEDETILHAMRVLQQRVDANKEQIALLQGENETKQKQIETLAPKADYAEKVLLSRSTYVTDQIAKEMGTTAISLNKRLRELGIIIRRNDQWVLTAKYVGQSYTDTRTHLYTHRDGSQGSSMQTVWTEKGRQLIHRMIEAADKANQAMQAAMRESNANVQPQNR